MWNEVTFFKKKRPSIHVDVTGWPGNNAQGLTTVAVVITYHLGLWRCITSINSPMKQRRIFFNFRGLNLDVRIKKKIKEFRIDEWSLGIVAIHLKVDSRNITSICLGDPLIISGWHVAHRASSLYSFCFGHRNHLPLLYSRSCINIIHTKSCDFSLLKLINGQTHNPSTPNTPINHFFFFL